MYAAFVPLEAPCKRKAAHGRQRVRFHMSERRSHLRVVRREEALAVPDPTRDQPAPPEHTPPGAHAELEVLYRAYAPYVAAIAARILGRDHEVDDLVQDTFVNALRGLASLREPAAVKGWLAKIAVRLATRRLKKRRLLRALHLSREELDSESVVALDASPEERAFVGKVYRVLDRLPVDERVAFVLRYIEGEPLHRIPELCGCSLSTAQRRLARAQAKLEQELGHD